MRPFRARTFGVVACLAVATLSQNCCSNRAAIASAEKAPQPKVAGTAGHQAITWNKTAASGYLEQRENWWLHWKGAKRDHDTFCISCHTNLPFVFAQSALRGVSTEKNTPDNYGILLEDVKTRVRSWKDIEPYYGELSDYSSKGPASRGTEAILNAAILAYHDSQTGQLSDDTRQALQNMWALQQTSGNEKGTWLWQEFRLKPWESGESPYFGATLAALAVGIAPGGYSASPEIQNNLKLLREYLKKDYPDQTLLNRVGLLWASTKLPGLLTSEEQKKIIAELLEKQRSDGGWSLTTLQHPTMYWGIQPICFKWRRNDGSVQEQQSDGLATGY